MPPLQLLVVDDSAVVRKLLKEALAASSEVQVVGTAASGEIALAKIPQLNPDVITLDVEMPGMNGIQTLSEIRLRYPKLPVIMFSAMTERGAAITLEALALGASDYMTKPSGHESLASAIDHVRRDLVARVVSLAAGRSRPAVAAAVSPIALKRKNSQQRIDILAIGVSTGGPCALAEVLPRLPQDFPVPVVVVQHMPPVFTRMLAERLGAGSKLSVCEAEEGKMLEAGKVWIAPGNYHLSLTRKGTGVMMNLNQNPPENSCRPSVDVLFRSVAQAYGPNALGLIMTGMGSDGMRGALQMSEAGAQILAQDQASSVVWGMPGAVVQAGLADKICGLAEISEEVVRRVTTYRKFGAAAGNHQLCS